MGGQQKQTERSPQNDDLLENEEMDCEMGDGTPREFEAFYGWGIQTALSSDRLRA